MCRMTTIEPAARKYEQACGRKMIIALKITPTGMR
jgi:hypothetical protein